MNTTVPAAGDVPTSIREWEALWTKVLSRHVDEAGTIDFSAIGRSRDDLDRVVAFVAAHDPAFDRSMFSTRQAQLAYYINAYNALAMLGIVEAGIPASLGGLRKFTFFNLRKFTIGKTPISLYSFENDVIRPLGEERIHFALNCMVVSCPRLPRTAFSAEQLDKRLDQAARAFIADDRNVRVDTQRREVWLSSIFKFYTDDFLKRAPSLVAYVNRFRTEQIPAEFQVRFTEYDWAVNDRAKPNER